MLKKMLYPVRLLNGTASLTQASPGRSSPIDGVVHVPTTASISLGTESIPQYIGSIGTCPGGIDSMDEGSAGNATGYLTFPGLAENTQIYGPLTLFFFDRPNIACASTAFKTEVVLPAPPCTPLKNPVDGPNNINVANSIGWNYPPPVTSYELAIATTPAGGAILSNLADGNVLSYNPPTNLAPATRIFVTLDPQINNDS